MSEKSLTPEQRAIEALALEPTIEASATNGTDQKARKTFRSVLEVWLENLQDPEVQKEYSAMLGGLDPNMAKMRMLDLAKDEFPNIVKEYGWKPEMEKLLQSSEFDQAA